MPFEPEKITREHVLEAVQRIESQKLVLKPSTRYDVIVNGKPYPPKEIMRHAHAVMNGEIKWSLPGGRQTNDYLKKFGLETVRKKVQPADPMRGMIERYKKHIHQTQFADESYKWVLIEKMRGKPDLDAADFLSEIKQMEYKNLVYPMGIAVLQHITRERPEQVRYFFRTLFNDGLDLAYRLKTFSDTTLKIYREIDGKLNHHQDERSMATYLTFFNPDQYMLFKTTVYENYCKLINVETKKPKEKYPHYLELLDEFIEEYVVEDQELISLKEKYLPKDRFEDKDHRLLAQDIWYQMLDKLEREARKTEKRYWRVGTSDNKGNNFWSKMKSGSYASIGWADLGDLTAEDIEKKEIIELINQAGYYDGNKSTISRKAGEIFNFLKTIKPGDILLAQDGSQVLGIGAVNDTEIRYDPSQEFPHIRSVDWIIQDLEDFISNEGNLTTVIEITSPQTISRVNELLGFQKPMQPTSSMSNHSKNTILFGPPGTGKTYNSINHAVSIIESKDIEIVKQENRVDVKKRFDEYQKAGRVVFTTFHQSMSYEDFIEGIKPETIEEQISYEVKDGTFKTLCIDAAFSIAEGLKNDNTDRVLNFSRLYDQFVDSIEVTLSTPGTSVEAPTKSGGKIQIAGISPQGNILVKHIDGARTYTISKQRLIELDQNIDDLEDVSNVNTTFRGIIGGSNSSAYYAILKVIRSLKPNVNKSKAVFSQEEKLGAVRALTPDDYKKSPGLPYVIIIDEINRGNVSQIFGELITLLEDDKRLGKDGALEVTLPYSKQKFGVPSNVYTLGTLNTADRSVEALDTALRRRFDFVFMPPDVNAINDSSDLSSKGISLKKLFNTLNERLKYLLDEDHQLGHSYFMGVHNEKDLRSAFKNKIIPLLKEYFYNDYQKMSLVLGAGFIEKKNSKPNFAVEDDEITRDIFNVIPITDNFDFINAIKSIG